MAKRRRAYDEEAWANAKKIRRLTVRQVEMARALGMNPRRSSRVSALTAVEACDG
jgi:hypothetical protein